MVLHRGAKAGRTDHRAVGASQASRGHVVPSGMLEVVKQQLPDPAGVEFAAHLRPGPRHGVGGCALVIGIGGRMGEVRHDLGAARSADFDQELVAAFIKQLRQRQIVAGLRAILAAKG